MRFRSALGTLGVVALAGSLAAAQAPQPPQAQQGRGGREGGAPMVFPPYPLNLQVLPKDKPREETIVLMRTFQRALGIDCNHCHVFTVMGDPNNDFATDIKPPKLVARVMMRMVDDINTRLAANIKKPADQITRVECMTCHRGAVIPTLPPPAARGAAPAPAPATPPQGR